LSVDIAPLAFETAIRKNGAGVCINSRIGTGVCVNFGS
jgi:hypothetical protein